MLRACIEIISTGESTWIPLPNGDLGTVIYDFTGDRDYEVAIITGLKDDGITSFVHNSFHKCDIFELNNLIFNLQTECTFTEIEDYVVLNLFLEYNNCDCKEVEEFIRKNEFRIYREVKDMGDIAFQYLEENSSWYQDAKEYCTNFDSYFDFKSYGEEVLEPNGTAWLYDKNYKIMVEVF